MIIYIQKEANNIDKCRDCMNHLCFRTISNILFYLQKQANSVIPNRISSHKNGF